MTEWWTYRPSDFLLFSPRTYYRLFELYNADLWPAQGLCVGLGLALWLAFRQRRAGAPRAALLLLGAAWCWVAWAFHWQRFSTINWAASGFAAAFAVQGLLLSARALRGSRGGALPSRRRRAGLALLLFALVLYPAIGVGLGRAWRQAEVAGLAPDPTAVATLGVLLLLPPARFDRLLWPLPLAWCALAGTMLATMHAADAFVLPAAAVLAVWAARADADAGGEH